MVGQAQTFLVVVVDRVDTTLLVALATMVTLVHKGAVAGVELELPLMMEPYPLLVRIHPGLAMLQVVWRQAVRVALV